MAVQKLRVYAMRVYMYVYIYCVRKAERAPWPEIMRRAKVNVERDTRTVVV